MSVALSATRVTHRYSATTALDDITLYAQAGEIIAIVGESGSGKTTLLRCFNGMIEPTSGTVRVGDLDVRAADLTSLRRTIGYVQQHGGLLPHWTVAENIGLILRAKHSPNAKAVSESLQLVGLNPDQFAARYPHQLSGGQRQRVALARSLAAEPDALLLDEPFGALDPVSRSEVQETFARIQRELRLTMVLVTHDLAEAARLASDIVVMRSGRIEQRGTIASLRDQPASDYVRTLTRTAIAQLEALHAGAVS
jgi:osmoprotectant transport system ATP-binding protein